MLLCLESYVFYLQGNVFPKRHVSGHGQVIQLQHVRNTLEACQIFLNLHIGRWGGGGEREVSFSYCTSACRINVASRRYVAIIK